MDSLTPVSPDAMAELDRLMARGAAFFGSRYALMGGAMSWVSERNLVAALSNAGAFGVIACGAMEPDRLAQEIAGTQALTQRPFGVNLITMHPRLDQLVDTCLEAKVGHIVFAGGIPPGAAIKKAKDGGAKVVCFAPALALAKKLVRSGADALVIEGSEAGGHIGPVSLNVLAQEILPHIRDVPVFVAGGIGRGEAILSYLEMGAAGAQLGTRFVCATECIAHPLFKRAFIRGNARDAVPTLQIDERFPVIPVRALQNAGHQALHGAPGRGAGEVPVGRADQGSRAARHRAFLGRRPAPGGGRRRCGERQPHGRPVRRHGGPRGPRRRDHRRVDRPGRAAATALAAAWPAARAGRAFHDAPMEAGPGGMPAAPLKRPEPSAGEAARLGGELRDARLALGLSIEDLVASLRIRQPYLVALEEGRVRDLPAPAYAVAFVRAYAKALGLDADEVVRRFREASGPAVQRKTDLVFPEPVPERGVPAGAVMLVGAVLAVGAYIGWYQWSGSGTRTVDVVPAPPRARSRAAGPGSRCPAGCSCRRGHIHHAAACPAAPRAGRRRGPPGAARQGRDLGPGAGPHRRRACC